MNSDDAVEVRDTVRRVYSAIADRPQHDSPFRNGRGLAVDLGYPPDLLDSLPAIAVDAFSGVSCVPLFAGILEGTTVLDLGCGAGMDTLIAARRSGKTGRVVGVDFSETMLERARGAVQEAGIDNVELLSAGAEHLPIETASIDVALVNGIFNLNPARARIFRELSRVVRPGGLVFAAEIVLIAPLSAQEKSQSSNWFS